MIVFAGRIGGGYWNSVWALSLADPPVWTTLATTGPSPPGRWGHSAIYDPLADRMVVFGGWNGLGALNDAWELPLGEGSAWNPLTPAGSPPPPRGFHAGVFDPVGERLIVYGGRGGPYFNDVWALSLSGTLGWSLLAPGGTAPPARYGHSAIYDWVRNRMVIFAGLGPSNLYRDTWALSLTSAPLWATLTPMGTPPAARYAHTAIYDRARDQMTVLGGERRHDTWTLIWGTPVSVPENPDLSSPKFNLACAPNPSRAETFVQFELEKPERIEVEVFDIRGRRVKRIAHGWFPSGHHESAWNGCDELGRQSSPGVYFVRVAASGRHATRRIVRIH
jgi:hypothetical protein